MHVTTAHRQSRKRILRSGITLTVRAAGSKAFRSRPLSLTARARAQRRLVAASRTLTLRPGRQTVVLIPNARAARNVRRARLAALSIRVTVRGPAGTQTRRLTIRLTR